MFSAFARKYFVSSRCENCARENVSNQFCQRPQDFVLAAAQAGQPDEK